MSKTTAQANRQRTIARIHALRAQGFTLEQVGKELNIGKPGGRKQAVSHYLKGQSRIAKWTYGTVKKRGK